MTATQKIRKRRIVRTYDHDETTILRFTDGLIVNTRDCPDGTPARSHWVAAGACLHTAHSTQIAAAAETAATDTRRRRLADAALARHAEEQHAQQARPRRFTRRCAACTARCEGHWCSETCRRADEGPIEEDR